MKLASRSSPRWARFVGLAVGLLLTVASGVIIVVMNENPLHLRYFPSIFVALVAVATISATVTALLIPVNWPLRVAVAGTCGVIGAACTAILGYAAIAGSSPGRVNMRGASADGRYTLESVQGRNFLSIDPQYDVLLVSGNGVLVRESLVWRGVEEGAAPASLRFSGPDEIELITDDGCRYRSRFDGALMTVNPVWEVNVQADCASPR